MPETVKLTINGTPIEAEKGKLLIEVARDNDIEIPSFCYYEGFTLQAACRMFLVEVEKTPKLQVGCTLPVAELNSGKAATPREPPLDSEAFLAKIRQKLQ